MSKRKGALQQEQCAEQSTPQASLLARYRKIRKDSESICKPLQVEDYGLQTMIDVSPPRWHLAHVTWFFETFLLKPYLSDYQEFHPRFSYLFNSYYETVGSIYPRSQRGFFSRPTTEEIYRYRAYVDEHMQFLLQNIPELQFDEINLRSQVGLHHEQQHQELLLTDIKYNFATNPLCPVYREQPSVRQVPAQDVPWTEHNGGMVSVGADGTEFRFDNETPRHDTFLHPFRMASRPVSNGEYLEFMDAGAYDQVDLWLSEGWKTVKEQQWQAPLYWQKVDDNWYYMTLAGLQPVDISAPVCHVSFYEADAYARWAGKRLPTEFEWETIASTHDPCRGHFLDSGYYQPRATTASGMCQLFGDVWEWTQSPYSPYPGFTPLSGTLGEYNGKFMCSQMTLRGGSCVTVANHIRASYRNFFYPGDRWQYSGIRLAEDA